MESKVHTSLLKDEDLLQLLDLQFGDNVAEPIRRSVLVPVTDLLERPKKSLRAQLTEVGAKFGSAHGEVFQRNLAIAREVIEALHAGSLAVDDIEDESAFRRGEPSLHERYGVPIALNAGNWLYFWPLELVRRMELDPSKELAIYRLYHRTLLRAHFGQGLDVGIPVDTVSVDKLYATCLGSLELKSGTLTSFAVGLGALVGDTSPETYESLLRFGHRFGVALQMLDDIGNFSGQRDPQKRWEDLRLRRPTWIWAVLAESEGDIFRQFHDAVIALPDEALLVDWIGKNESLIARAKSRALDFLNESLSTLKSDLGGTLVDVGREKEIWSLLDGIKERLMNAY